jgi:hypothetical protein
MMAMIGKYSYFASLISHEAGDMAGKGTDVADLFSKIIFIVLQVHRENSTCRSAK